MRGRPLGGRGSQIQFQYQPFVLMRKVVVKKMVIVVEMLMLILMPRNQIVGLIDLIDSLRGN